MLVYSVPYNEAIVQQQKIHILSIYLTTVLLRVLPNSSNIYLTWMKHSVTITIISNTENTAAITYLFFLK